MIFTHDMYDNLKQSKLFLANPNKKYIGTIYNAKNVELEIKFNDISTASFTVHDKEENGDLYPHYDDIKDNKLVEIQHVGWYKISEVNEVRNGVDNYKEVKCETLEVELTGKRVDSIDGVFSLYAPEDAENSIMHIVTNNTGWNIGHIDNELQGKWRTFSIDTSKVYNLLMSDVSKSFECVFVYNTYEKSINVYKLSNIGNLTNIVLSYKNVLKTTTRNSKASNVITKLKVVGADGFDVRSVNYGLDYILNLDYYMTTDWGLSQSTVDAWNTYKTKCASYRTSFSSLLTTLQTQQSELLVLENELKEIQANIAAKNEVIGTSLQAHGNLPPISTDSDYTIYQNAITELGTLITQEALKKIDVTNKKTQTSSTQSSMDAMANEIDYSYNFTTDQLNELIPFITENDTYEDSTFAETDTMTANEVLNMKLELLQNASNELDRASKPQFTCEVEANNLFAIKDDDGYETYKDMQKDCEVGNLISIRFNSNNFTTARLIKLGIKFDSLDTLDLTFSDKSRFDSELIQLGGLLATAGRASSTINLNKIGYDAASNQASEVRDFMNNSFNATLNAMKSNDNQELLIDQYGLKMQKWLPDQNKYSDYASWWNQNTLLFTSDGFKTAQCGIGLFQNELGEKYYGVLADVICGKLLMGEKLTISNSSGSYSINKDGFISSASVVSGEITNTYKAGFNPSTPNHIIYASINDTDVFSIDTVNNRLKMSGEINSTVGNIGGWTIGESGLTSPSSRMKLGGSGLSLYNSLGSYLGGIASTSSTNNAVAIIKSASAAYLGIGYTNDTNPNEAMSINVPIMYTPNPVSVDGISYESGFHLRLTDLYLDYGNIYVTANVEADQVIGKAKVSSPLGEFSSLNINNVSFTPSDYYTKTEADGKYQPSGSYASSSHTHSSASGTFTANGKTLYITNGIIMSIV